MARTLASFVSTAVRIRIDVDILRSLGIHLRADGYRVRTANGGAEALQALHCELPSFVLVPVLLFLYPHESPATITSVWAYARQGRIDYRTGVRFAAATLPGAVLGAALVAFLSRGLFDTIFGLALITVAAFVIIRARTRPVYLVPAGSGMTTRTITDACGDTYVYHFSQRQGILLSTGVGFLSSLLGIGGGIIHMPVLVEFLHFPVHIATATSHFILTFMALAGTLEHLVSGQLGPHAGLDQVLLLSLGVVPGAQVGAHFAHRVRGGLIVQLLGVALLMVDIRLTLTPLLH